MLDQFIKEFTEEAAMQGVKQVDYYIEENAGTNTSIYKGEVESQTLYKRLSVFVEGNYNGFRGTAYTENLERGYFAGLIHHIKETAIENQKPFVPRNMPACEKPQETKAPETSVLQLFEAERAAYSDVRMKHVQCQARQGSRRVILSNQSGQKAEDYQSWSGANVFVVASEGGKTQTGRCGALADAAKAVPADPVELAERAQRQAVSMLHAESLPSADMQVILGGRVIREMFSIYVSSFYGQTALDNKSVLKGKAGQMIAADTVTLWENPNGMLPRHFDDEGTTCRAKKLIDAGEFSGWLHSLQSAGAMQEEPTGNGFKREYQEDVVTGYTNLILDAGPDGLETIYRQEQDGLYITECDGMFAGANAISGDFSLISKGYAVKHGELGQAVSQITIAGNFFEMLKQIRAAANDSETESFGTSTVTAPSVWVGNLSVSGRSE